MPERPWERFITDLDREIYDKGRFGALIRRLRSEKGYSQERFAEVCRIDRSYMGMIERGEVSVTLAMIVKLAQGLGVSLVELFSQLEKDSSDDSSSK